MKEIYNIYITTGSESEGYLGADGRHSPKVHGAHLWIHNGEIEKNHIEEDVDVDEIVSSFGIGYHENRPFVPFTIREIYEDIQRINKLDPTTPEKRLCKLFEEAGELAQAINKKLGRKVVKETDEEVLDLICEEAADTIQCALSFMDSVDMDLTFMEDTFVDGSNKEDIPTEEVLMKLFKHIGCLSYDIEHSNPTNKVWVNKCISKAFILAGHYGIKESEVIARMPSKNVKWEKVINDRNNKK